MKIYRNLRATSKIIYRKYAGKIRGT